MTENISMQTDKHSRLSAWVACNDPDCVYSNGKRCGHADALSEIVWHEANSALMYGNCQTVARALAAIDKLTELDIIALQQPA